ncbi:MAG: tetraacyldisaccharide 4'-kinase [Acidobacteria bacterium]|nr:tetraacyldisaccharide 4'-kinase [Acidobacteriota bacterium]
MIDILSAAYGAAAAWRRRWYARDPSRPRRLRRPVVSVGNLRVGGTGKTPMVEYIARRLLERGEHPAILTRGYARREPRDGVTVVSDGTALRADLAAAGDEPLMLARALPGVAVLVSADRYLSGCLAERRLGATVHILDDGFQHLDLARDVDLLIASEDDLEDRPLPAGRLREGLAAAHVADAALVTAGYDTAADRIGRALGVSTVFRVTRAIGAPRMIAGARDSVVVPPGARVFVVTGIARPERFVADITSAGWELAGVMEFRDHHPYDDRDVARITAAGRAAASAIVLTTEKDAVRLAVCTLGDLPIAAVPLVIGVEPADAFRGWLIAKLAAHSAPRTQPGTRHPAPGTRHPDQ